MKIEVSIYMNDKAIESTYIRCLSVPRVGEAIMLDNEEYYIADVIYRENKIFSYITHTPILMVVSSKYLKGEHYEKRIKLLSSHGWIRE